MKPPGRVAVQVLITSGAFALLAWGGLAAADSCVDCHAKQEERLAAPTRTYPRDIHAQRGLGCVACHGGDPTAPTEEGAMDPDKGFRGSITRGDVAGLCASCHADAAYMKRFNPRPYIFSVAEYRTSVHCKKESEGDVKVATCTGCHGVHGILPHTDPASPVYARNVPRTCAHCHNAEYMKGRTVRTDQFTLYSTSVHGVALLEKGDVSAPACNDCHGNHGAAPPGVREVTLVCGTCHGREAELFEKSKMKAAMDRMGKPGCVTCHSNHGVKHPTDAMLAVEGDGACGGCHTPGSAGERGAASIIGGFRALRDSDDASDQLLGVAEKLGMETGAGREAWKEARDRLVALRAGIHSFDATVVSATLGEGGALADRAGDQARAALRDWRVRRIGMALSLIVIVFLAALLVLKIRALERG